MSEEVKKQGFFKNVLKSIKDFDKYEDFALETRGVAFKYLIKLITIFCIIISIVYTYKIVDNVNNLYVGLKDKLPDFSYQDGNLKANSENPTIIEDYGNMLGVIIVDTQTDTNKIHDTYYKDYIAKYGSASIFTENSLILYRSELNGQVSYNYSDLLSSYNINSFTKQDIINNIDNINIASFYFSIYIMIFIYLWIVYFISIIIDVLILSCLGYIVSRMSRLKLKFAPAFSVSIHAITLPILLNLIYIIVNLLTGFEIKYFDIMYNTIAYIYVIVAILMIKTDFLNRQAELIKIAQEQMKVKEDMKDKEDEEEKKKEEEKDNSVCPDKKEDNNSNDEEDNNINSKKEKSKKEKKDKSSDEPLGDTSYDAK